MYYSPLSTGGTVRQKEKLKNKIERLEMKAASLRSQLQKENENCDSLKSSNNQLNQSLQQYIQESAYIEQKMRNEMFRRSELNKEIRKQEQFLATPSIFAEQSRNQMELNRLNRMIEDIELDIQAKEEKLEQFRKKQQMLAVSQQHRKSSILIDQENLSNSLLAIPNEPIPELDEKTLNLQINDTMSFEIQEQIVKQHIFHFDEDNTEPIPNLEDENEQNSIQQQLRTCLSIFDAVNRAKDILNTTNANISRARATIELARTKKKEYLGQHNNLEWLEHTRSRRHRTIEQLDETIRRYNKELSQLMKRQTDLEQSIHLTKEQIARMQRRDTPDVPQLVGEMQSCKAKFKDRDAKFKAASKKIIEIDDKIEKMNKFLRPGVYGRLKNEIDTLRYEKNQLKVKLSDLQKINQSEIKRQAERGKAENAAMEEKINSLIFSIGKLKSQRKNVEQTIEYTKIAIVGAGLHVPPMKDRKKRVKW